MGPVGIGIAALGAYRDIKAAKHAKKQAKKTQQGIERQRRETAAFAGPERYLENYRRYQEAFKEAYRPWLVTEQDRAALSEQGTMQAFDADLARRGLSGSGLALAGRSAIRSGRQAQIASNLRAYRQAWEGAARDEAGATRAAEVNASLGAPYQYVPRPLGGSGAYAGALAGGVGTGATYGALTGYGGGDWQSWFRKPPASTAPQPWDEPWIPMSDLPREQVGGYWKYPYP